MDESFLKMCCYVEILDKTERSNIAKSVIKNKNMIKVFEPNLIGFASSKINSENSGLLISRKHPQLTVNIKSISRLMAATNLREKYARKLLKLHRIGLATLIGKNIDYNSVIPITNGKVKILINDENQVIIPSLLSYEDWVNVTKARHPKEYIAACSLKKRDLILNTIRHSIGIYDEAWHQLPESCYGHICRRFVQTICKKYPALDTNAKRWLEQKSLSENVDKLTLDADYFWDKSKFFLCKDPDNFLNDIASYCPGDNPY
ncbi:hypothetical protein [Endozoicomonas sp. ALE010]|uniref:hypothetical protein n=1 Tax=Endozoicomonas sp. ALE010 TaxID=3403081 RepID=UPI003BB7B719